MIKTFLKHYLYEQVINVFFKEVVKNFVRPKLDENIKRKIHVSYSCVGHADLLSYHGSDIEEVLLEVIREEIDREVLEQLSGYKGRGVSDFGIIYSP